MKGAALTTSLSPPRTRLFLYVHDWFDTQCCSGQHLADYDRLEMRSSTRRSFPMEKILLSTFYAPG